MKKRTQKKSPSAKKSGPKQDNQPALQESEAVPEKTLAYFKIGDTIRKYRKERNLKLQELAALIDMSSSMLSKIAYARKINPSPQGNSKYPFS